MISFSICSNNYLGKAQVLAASIKAAGNATVYLFLADRKEDAINYEDLGFDGVVPADELDIPNLQWMKENYSIVEFNTAIKPFAFSYLLKHTKASSFYYFDPDMCVYRPLAKFEQFWNGNVVLLTPHILTPIPFDNKFPGENLFLNHGTYNLGFLALRRSKVAESLLAWWSERMLTHCKIQLIEGFFVDQIWFNLVPGFFQQVEIITHPGWNMAYWNLHERHLTLENGQYKVNSQHHLFFYHFSSFDPSISRIHYLPNFRHSFSDNEVLKDLYLEYLGKMKSFEPEHFKNFHYFQGQYPLPIPMPTVKDRIIRKIRSKLK